MDPSRALTDACTHLVLRRVELDPAVQQRPAGEQVRAVGQGRRDERVAQRRGVRWGRARQDKGQTGRPLEKPVDLLAQASASGSASASASASASRGQEEWETGAGSAQQGLIKATATVAVSRAFGLVMVSYWFPTRLLIAIFSNTLTQVGTLQLTVHL